MSIYPNASYDIFSKEELVNKNIKTYWEYNFGHKILVEFSYENIGKYNTATEALKFLIKDFKKKKITEYSKNLKWAKGQRKVGTIKNQDLEKLENLTKEITLFLEKKTTGGYALKKMYSDVEKTQRHCYNINDLIPDEMHLDNRQSSYELYIELIDDLYKDVGIKYEYKIQTEELLKNYSIFLDDKNSILKKILKNDDSDLIVTRKNLRLIEKWTKKPGFLYQDEQKKDIETLKEDFQYFEELIQQHEIVILQEEKDTNYKETGYLETNIERKEREEKLFKKFNLFKSLISKCKDIQQISEMELIYKDSWKENNNKLAAFDDLTFEDYQQDSYNCEKSIRKLYETLNQQSSQILKPYINIKEFLQSPSEKLLIIRGMAGTGKTECINKIIEDYFQINPDYDVKLLSKKIIACSPTTVGAANIRQKGFFNAQTLDYFLNRWEEDRQVDIFIVDEASMLTKSYLARINQKFNKNTSTKFVFIGDEGQFRPYDFNKGADPESYALNLNYSSQIFGEGREVILENDFRLQKNFSTEYYKFLITLREGSSTNPLEALDNVLKRTDDITVVQESNKVIKFFNTKVHIGSSVRDRHKTDSSEEILYYLNKKDEFNEMKFSDTETLEGIEQYRDQKTRRPELGKLYAQYYPSVKKRLSKKNKLNTIVSLFRSNIKADIANILIRPHIFDDKYKDDTPILKGEVMFIKQRKNFSFKDYLIKTELGVGDSFIVTSEPQPINFLALESSQYKNEIENKIWLVEAKPVLKFSKGKIGNFLLNVMPEAFQLDSRKIVVWVGDLTELKNSKEELLDDGDLNEIYQNIVNEITKLKLDPNSNTMGLTEDDLLQIARVKYDYARVSFASQGGEWDNVIIQLEDTWIDESRFLYTCFTRAVERNYIFN